MYFINFNKSKKRLTFKQKYIVIAYISINNLLKRAKGVFDA